MNISEKIKTVNNKIKQNKSRYDLDKQTARILALFSGNVSKYKLLTDRDVLSGKGLLEKAAAIKIFEYSPFRKRIKAQTDIAEEQYQKLDDTYEFDKIIIKNPQHLKPIVNQI